MRGLKRTTLNTLSAQRALQGHSLGKVFTKKDSQQWTHVYAHLRVQHMYLLSVLVAVLGLPAFC